jgi:PAS domain S-box-containing protein
MLQNQLILLLTQNNVHYEALLYQAGFSPGSIQQATSGADGLRAVDGVAFDCLLLDIDLPDMTPDDFLNQWQRVAPQEHTALILMIPKQYEQQVVGYIDIGAHDYLVIEDLSVKRLWQTVNNAIEQVHMVRLLETQQYQIQRLDTEIEQSRHKQFAPGEKIGAGAATNGYGAVSAIIDPTLPEQLQQQADELKALYNASSVLFQSRNVLDLSHQISQAIVKEFKHIDCGILLKSKTGNKLVRAVRAGNLVKRPTTDLFLDGPGLVPEAIRTNAVIYAPYVKEHPYYVENDSATRSELVIPLRGMNGVVGVFDLQSSEEDAFSERDQRILQMFAERAAAALDVVQLYEEQDQHAARLEFQVAQRTAEFQRSKDKVETILNSIHDAIILVDASRVIEQMNPAFQMMFGYDGDTLFREKIDLLFDTPIVHIEAIIHSALTQQAVVRHELTARRKDGSSFIADTIFSPLAHESFRQQVICTLRDMSLQKQLEDELRKALEREKELNEIKSRFTSMVSHEFRTPLAVILSTAGIVDIHLEKLSPEGIRERLKKISVQVGRLTRLMEDVLTFSKADALGLSFQPAVINMVALCNTIIEELAHSHPHADQIRFTPQGDCDAVLADEALIRHILSNLLSNAMKYSPADGPITFDLACSTNAMQFTVKDEGIGIPEVSQKNLYESFHRATNVGNVIGTGLGLAIVKKAVDAHGGTIRFESKEGQGTCFEVVLPITGGKQPATEPQSLSSSRFHQRHERFNFAAGGAVRASADS